MGRDYVYVQSAEEAVRCLEDYGGRARIIAGGTDVMPEMRQGRVSPDCLVDITRIPGLDRIEIGNGFVTVGAAVTFAALREDSFLNQHVHALVEAARSVGAPAIQNAATWTGNIVQAMPAADGAVVAVALEAEARVMGPSGATWRLVESLFKGPGTSVVDPTREMVTALRFRHPGPGTGGVNPGTAWRRVGRRAALVLPILNCAVTTWLEKTGSPRVHAGADLGRVKRATIALGPVAPRPKRMREAESYLEDRVPSREAIAEAARLAAREASPRTSVMRASREYRLKVLPVLVREALTTALQRAEMEGARGETDGGVRAAH